MYLVGVTGFRQRQSQEEQTRHRRLDQEAVPTRLDDELRGQADRVGDPGDAQGRGGGGREGNRERGDRRRAADARGRRGVRPGLQRERRDHVPCSRVASGRVVRSPGLAKRGFVAGDNLQPWKARALLALALAKTSNADEIQRMFDTY